MGPCHCIAGLMSGLRLLAKFSLARHVDPWGMKPHAMPCHAWVRNQSLVTQSWSDTLAWRAPTGLGPSAWAELLPKFQLPLQVLLAEVCHRGWTLAAHHC